MSWHYAGDIAQCQMFSKPSEHWNISRPCACLLMIASQGQQLIRLRNGVALCGRVCLGWPGGAVIPQGWLLKEGNSSYVPNLWPGHKNFRHEWREEKPPQETVNQSRQWARIPDTFVILLHLLAEQLKSVKRQTFSVSYGDASSEPPSSCYLISYLRKVLYLKCFIRSGKVLNGGRLLVPAENSWWSGYLTGRPLFLTLLKRSSSAVHYEPCWYRKD